MPASKTPTWKSAAKIVLRDIRRPIHFMELCEIILKKRLVPPRRTSKPWTSLHATLSDNSSQFFRPLQGYPVYGLVTLKTEYETLANAYPGGLEPYIQSLVPENTSNLTKKGPGAPKRGRKKRGMRKYNLPNANSNNRDKMPSTSDDVSFSPQGLLANSSRVIFMAIQHLKSATTPLHLNTLVIGIFANNSPKYQQALSSVLESEAIFFKPNSQFDFWGILPKYKEYFTNASSWNGNLNQYVAHLEEIRLLSLSSNQGMEKNVKSIVPYYSKTNNPTSPLLSLIIQYFQLVRQPTHYSAIADSFDNSTLIDPIPRRKGRRLAGTETPNQMHVLSLLKSNSLFVEFANGFFGLKSLLPVYEKQSMRSYISLLSSHRSLTLNAFTPNEYPIVENSFLTEAVADNRSLRSSQDSSIASYDRKQSKRRYSRRQSSLNSFEMTSSSSRDEKTFQDPSTSDDEFSSNRTKKSRRVNYRDYVSSSDDDSDQAQEDQVVPNRRRKVGRPRKIKKPLEEWSSSSSSSTRSRRASLFDQYVPPKTKRKKLKRQLSISQKHSLESVSKRNTPSIPSDSEDMNEIDVKEEDDLLIENRESNSSRSAIIPLPPNIKRSSNHLIDYLAHWSTIESLDLQSCFLPMTWKDAANSLWSAIQIPLHFRDAAIIILGLGLLESKSATPWNSLNSTLNKYSSLFWRLEPGKPVYGISRYIKKYKEQARLFGGTDRYAKWLINHSPSQIDLALDNECHFPFSQAKNFNAYAKQDSRATITWKSLFIKLDLFTPTDPHVLKTTFSDTLPTDVEVDSTVELILSRQQPGVDI